MFGTFTVVKDDRFHNLRMLKMLFFIIIIKLFTLRLEEEGEVSSSWSSSLESCVSGEGGIAPVTVSSIKSIHETDYAKFFKLINSDSSVEGITKKGL